MDRFNVTLAWLKLNWLVTTSLAIGVIGIMFGCGSLLLAVRTTRELHQLKYTVRHDLGDPDATRLGKFRLVPTLDADGKPIMIPCPGQPGTQCTKEHRVRQSAWEEMESLDGRIHKLAAEAETRRLFEKVVQDRRRAESAEITAQWRAQVDSLLASGHSAEVTDDSDPPPVVPEGPLDGDVLPKGDEFDRQVADFCAKQNPVKHGEKFYLTGCGGGSTHEDSTYVCTQYDDKYPFIHDCDEVKD